MNFNCKIFFSKTLQSTNIQFIYNKQTCWSLLSALESYSIPIDYQCRSGYCGSCRAILKEGTVRYYIKPLAFCIHPKEIFTCCCFPTENIILQI